MTELRSVQREQERAKALVALALQHGVSMPTGKKLQQEAADARLLWKGAEPLAFDAYVREVAGIDLWPKQADAWALPGLMRPSYLFSSERSITTWLLVWGKRSGKGAFSSLVITYLPYVLSHFKEDPRKHFSRITKKVIAAATSLDIVNFAPTAAQALQIFFNYAKSWLGSPLFKDIEMYPRADKMTHATDQILFPEFNMRLFSKSSSSVGAEGYNVFAWVTDELDEFRDSQDNPNADRILNFCRRTQFSTFGRAGLGFITSYPRMEDGPVLRAEKRFLQSNAERAAKGLPPMFYVDKAGTAEIRPDFSLSDPEIQEEYANDPDSAAAMFECRPMAAEFAFFKIEADDLSEWADDDRPAICEVIETQPQHPSLDGTMRDYVCVEIENIERQPGATYFLTIDGGVTGDAYALCVGHIDTSNEAAEWICPFCASPEVLAAAQYRKLPMPETETLDNPTSCGICGQMPIIITPVMGNRGWYKREGGEGKAMVLNGKVFNLPHWYEDLLIDVQPQKSTALSRKRKEVFLPGMHAQTQKLITGLSVLQARTDPWQTIEMIQAIHSETGVDIDKMTFGQPDQLKRALLCKFYLNNHMMSLRSHPKRDKEWRQIQRKGGRIDHPAGGGKDAYDVEAMNIFCGATYHCSELAMYL